MKTPRVVFLKPKHTFYGFVLYYVENENTSCGLSIIKTHSVFLYLRIYGLSKIKTHRCFFIYVYIFKNKT